MIPSHFDNRRSAAHPGRALRVLGALLLITAAASAQPTNWPVFRGVGIAVPQGTIPADWDGPTGKNILWKAPLELPGQNSPIIWNDTLFVCGADESKQVIQSFDAVTGKLRWERTVGAPDPSNPPKVMDDTGLAPSTMTTDGQRAYAIFPTGDLVAVDFAGNVVWSKNLGTFDSQYGYASSLTIWREKLIVQLDLGLDASKGKSALVAYDGATGNEAWRTPRPVPNSWASPIVVETPAGPRIITVADPWTIAYDPETGKERWRAKCVYGDVAPSPAYANGVAFVAMENSEAHAIKVDGVGDVTASHILWHSDETMPDIVSPLATEQFVFVMTSHGTVTCLDAKTGAKLWSHDFEGPLCASPILIGNVVHLIQRDGATHRFEAAGEFKLLNSPALGEPVYATPAVAGNRIYIRGKTHLYCIAER